MKSLNPDAITKPTKVYISSNTHYELHILGCCRLQIRDDKSSILNCEFLITNYGPSILGLEDLLTLKGQLFLLTTVDGYNEVLDNFLTTELNCEKSRTTSRPFHPDVQERDFETLKTDVNNNTALKFKDSERRVDKDSVSSYEAVRKTNKVKTI